MQRKDLLRKVIIIAFGMAVGHFINRNSDRLLADKKAPPKYKVHIRGNHQINNDGLNHPKRMFDVAEGLIHRVYTNPHFKLILGDNFKWILKTIFMKNLNLIGEKS
jgi:hypothetical protein